MVTLGNALTRGLGLGLLTGVFLFGCQGPDEFLRADEGSGLSGFGGLPPGTGGDTGTGGFVTGTGGIQATGGVTGTGGRATGGVTGTGGRATGGITGTGGGITGTGGRATGGVTGAAGSRGTGGFTGAAGSRGTGGFTGTAGTRGTGGFTGTAGSRGTGGFTGTAGSRGTGGLTGTAGSRGTAGSTGTGPCAGLCDSPTIFTTTSYSSGNVGTGAACFETTASIQGGNCSNVTAPRTFSVNGKVETCGQNWPSLPAKIGGGYCFEFTAGSPDFRPSRRSDASFFSGIPARRSGIAVGVALQLAFARPLCRRLSLSLCVLCWCWRRLVWPSLLARDPSPSIVRSMAKEARSGPAALAPSGAAA